MHFINPLKDHDEIPQDEILFMVQDSDQKLSRGADTDHVAEYWGVSGKLLSVWLLEYHSVIH